MRKRIYLLYIIAVLLILLIPFVGMSFWANESAVENQELNEWPSLREGERWNIDYLQETGEYFEDHFAFRRQMITANSVLWGKSLKISSTEQVVVGKDGWLFFGGTLDDYTGQNLLSERELYDIVHNLSLMQEYVEQCGSQFYLTIVPNKNTIYEEYMPYYYRRGESSNLEQLVPLLEEEGIHYVDILTPLEEENEILYFQRDSHWNHKGAVLAYRTLLETVGKEHETYLNAPVYIAAEHVGDLDEMLYPLAAEPEEDTYYDKVWEYQYQNDVSDNMDAWIETRNSKKEGTLLMYRDSFGESLLPFLAEEYGEAYFSRLVPYNLNNVLQYKPDTVIVERVERKLAAFATELPIMEAPRAENVTAPQTQTETTVDTEKNGAYLVIRGKIDEDYIERDSDIFVAVSDAVRSNIKTYQAFYTLTEDEDGNGYLIYLKQDSLPSARLHINVIVENDGQSWIVASEDVEVTWGKE